MRRSIERQRDYTVVVTHAGLKAGIKVIATKRVGGGGGTLEEASGTEEKTMHGEWKKGRVGTKNGIKME